MPSRHQTSQEALECLIEGHQRFVQRRSLHGTISDQLSTGKVRWLDH